MLLHALLIAGRIPGGYFKRERGPTEKDTLTSRLIDRPIRPLFAEGWRCDTQVTVTVLSHDMENDPDIVAMIGCSAAYNLARRTRWRDWLQRFDHAAIFAMIAGTYTPFTLRLERAWSLGLTAGPLRDSRRKKLWTRVSG